MKSDVDDLDRPNTVKIGGRLRSERQRLRLNRAEAANLMGVTEQKFNELETTLTSIRYAEGFKLLAQAGFDVLWIIFDLRNEIGKADGRAPGDQARHALAQLAGIDRQRLLLHLATHELKQLITHQLEQPTTSADGRSN